MSLVLAVDTAGVFGSLALLDGDRLVEEFPMHSPDGYGHVLFGYLQALLARHDVGLHDIALFAAAAGPGSFTGVRVGLTAVKGLAEATGRRAAGVSSLQALAFYGTGERRAVVVDARRGEVYGAVYDSALRPVVDEAVAPFPVWRESAGGSIDCVVSTDLNPFRSSFPPETALIEQRVIAEAVARIALRDGGTDPAAIDANYVRRSDAELLWRDR